MSCVFYNDHIHILPCWGVVAWIRCPVCGGCHKVLADDSGPVTSAGLQRARCGAAMYVDSNVNYVDYAGGEEGKLRGMGFVWPRGREEQDPLDARVIRMKFKPRIGSMIIPRQYAALRGWTNFRAFAVWELLLGYLSPSYWV